MRIQTTMKILFFVSAAVLLLPAALQASVSIACYCTDIDGDGYGDPSSENCTFVGLDCDDTPCNDPEGCEICSCGTPECGQCARCIYPGAMDVCDGVDNDCDGSVDEEPDASASCDDGVSCTVDTCSAGICQHAPNDSLCNDGIWCNGQETCDAIDGCQPGEAPCQDDGEFCNGSESCDEDNDQCTSSGNPCSDGNGCTEDVCNETDDSCTYPCSATGYEDACCTDEACTNEPVCKTPVCRDGVIDPGEECGEPGLDACPADSKFCVDCVCSPVAISLSDFTVTGLDGGVEISWTTGVEEYTFGFNILRSGEEIGPYAAINAQVILAKGSSSQGADYSYTDHDVVNGTTYWYKLQEVEVNDNTIEYEPPKSATPASAAGACAASSAEAAAGGTSGSTPLNALFPVGLPLLLIGVWLGRAAYRRGR